ncbi:hypothetical protein FBU30_002358 [Linnemannia zychae]|nr:hypothetical protein FBU30_002358 [Linnemannia zychae]
MQRNRPGPAHFKAAFAGGSSQERTAQPRSDSTLRPIHHPPSWLETILMRPIRVECWTCLRPSWLHRGQRDATPSDWTCPNCQTHQKRDKDGNIEPVPEMFDSTLNEATSERISRSVRSRNRPYASKNTLAGSKDDIFCEMCSGHQRVVYQLLSNYIPDEDDENYEAFVGNADTYRRQLEERYPLACSNCIDKLYFISKDLNQLNFCVKKDIRQDTLHYLQ